MKYLGTAESKLLASLFYLQFGSKYNYLHHVHISMHSAIRFELSNRRVSPPHVTRKDYIDSRDGTFLYM